jgi:hypothetical protein
MFLIEIGAGVAAGSASLQASSVTEKIYRVRALDYRNRDMAHAPWHVAECVHDGRNRLCGSRGQRTIVWCFGRIATAMPICAPHGFAPAMMYSEIWLSFLLRLASLAPAQAGRILLWQPSWLAWLCREPGLWFGSPSRNYISGYRSLRNRTRCAPRRGTRWRQQTVLYHWRAGCVVLVCALYNAIAREALAARLGLLPFLGQAD